MNHLLLRVSCALCVLATSPFALAQERIVTAGQDGVPAPKRTKTVSPLYPQEALAQGIRGIVILEILIDPQGKVASADVIRSIAGLDEAALEAVRKWEYEVTKVEGQPVSVKLTVPITFAMKVPEVTRAPGIPELRQGALVQYPAGQTEGQSVTAEVTLDPEGQVAEAEVVKGDPPYSTALLTALRTWRFAPEGEGVLLSFRVEADFVPARGDRPRVDVRLTGLRRSESAQSAATAEPEPPPEPTETARGTSPSPVGGGPAASVPPVETPAAPAPVAEAPMVPAPVPANPVPPAPDSQPPAPSGRPVTQAPVTQAPVTQAPVTAPPVTPPPVTPPPVTPPPVTPPPVTAPPVTPPPAIQAPVTPPPVTQAPAPVAATPPSPASVASSTTSPAVGPPAPGPARPGAPTAAEARPAPPAPPVEVVTAPRPAAEAPRPVEPGVSAIKDVSLALGVPDLVRGRRPVPPPLARMAGTTGTVEVKFGVDASGAASVKEASGPEVLTAAATYTVHSWLFRRVTAERLHLVAVFDFAGETAKASVKPE